MKKYVIISGFNIRDNNRGTAALGYGSINFCIQHAYLQEGQELVNFMYVKKIWKKEYRDEIHEYHAENKVWKHHVFYIPIWEKKIYEFFHISLPFTKFGKVIKNLELVAAINGGDGFSDIYNTKTFFGRLDDIKIAMHENIPVVILPQTLGPFKEKSNYDEAQRILQYACAVYVRDDKFVPELKRMGVKYEIKKDLSAYMLPEPWNIDVIPNAVGINVSGLTYSNKFRTLSGQFEHYPKLIDRLVCHFRDKGHTVYLIPHSYCYDNPEFANDDMVASREVYLRLKDKTNVVLLDKDLISPQVKYVISKMEFFIGTRMHANFAAIYTKTPLFGLAYSYKFEGAFSANGLDGSKQTAMINNISVEQIDGIIDKIENVYQELVNSRK